MWFIDRIEKHGGTWILHFPKKIEGKSPLTSLPPGVTSEQEEKALLYFQKCVDALRDQGQLVKDLIHGKSASDAFCQIVLTSL